MGTRWLGGHDSLHGAQRACKIILVERVEWINNKLVDWWLVNKVKLNYPARRQPTDLSLLSTLSSHLIDKTLT